MGIHGSQGSTEFLVLKLKAPMQSWGGHTYEDKRHTEDFPVFSSLVGLIGGCLGYDRADSDKLSVLSKSIDTASRLDYREVKYTDDYGDEKSYQLPFSKMIDFQTIGWVNGVLQVSGDIRKDLVVSLHEYLCDAEFTVTVRVLDRSYLLMSTLVGAVKRPIYSPFLGRKCCIPTRPVFEGIVTAKSHMEALSLVEPKKGIIYCDTEEGSSYSIKVRDNLIFNDRNRMYYPRIVYVHNQK